MIAAVSENPYGTDLPERIYRYKHHLRRRIHAEVAIHCQGSLVQNCALEIFSSFFMAMTENIGKILGTTVFIEAGPMLDPPAEPPRDGWVNDVIDKAARILLDSGLVDSQAEGRNITVPVLSARDLLPTEEKQRGPLDDWLGRPG